MILRLNLIYSWTEPSREKQRAMDSLETVLLLADRMRAALFEPARSGLVFCYTTSEEAEPKPLALRFPPGNMASHHGSTEA